jgi:DNA polymerase III subunit beta
MKILVLPEKLRAALDIARKPVKSSSPIPALSHVCLQTTDSGDLTISGTDLRWTARASLSVKVEWPGGVTLSPKALADVLAACPDGEPLTIDVTDKHRATLTCGRAVVRLVGGNPEAFPPTLLLRADEQLSVPASVLGELIDSTAFAAARDESRPVLAGVLCEVKAGTLALAAADGHRLAVRSAPLPADTPDLSALVPAGPLREISSALGKTDDLVTLTVDDAHIQIESSAGTWALTRIEGQFPDYNRIIPPAATTQATCSRADLERAVGLATAFEDSVTDNGKTYRTCMARVAIEAESLTVRSRSDQGDQEGALTIPIELVGEPLTIAFNGTYLRDAVRALDSESVTLEANQPGSPAVLHPAGPRDGFLQICMPMHVARP